jgi:ankyrin repeat protein
LKEDPAVVQSQYTDLTPLLEVVNDLLEDTADDVYLDMMQLLLENGADPNATPTTKRNGHLNVQEDSGDAAALHRICLALKDVYYHADEEAARINRLESAAQLLKEYNATLSPSTEQLLHDAARRNQLDMTKFLIHNMGVSPNVKGRQGMTPLQFAARSGKTEAVEFLLEQRDINVDIQDERGQTALDAARLNNKDDIVALLEQHMSK